MHRASAGSHVLTDPNVPRSAGKARTRSLTETMAVPVAHTVPGPVPRTATRTVKALPGADDSKPRFARKP